MESPTIKKSWNKSTKTLDIIYPNLYYGGVYCLAPIIIYNIVNNLPDWICNRQFLDKHKITSNIMGFTLQYELDYYNIPKILTPYKIPLKKPRKQILFAGGPCINLNPDALSKYFYFLMLGESESLLPKILQHYPSKNFLDKIADYKGIYIPGKNKPTKAPPTDLNKIPYPLYQPLPEKINKNFTFGKAFILETERGCPFDCKFCPIHSFHNKVRYRSLSNLKNIIDTGIKLNKRNKVVIYSPSFTHPQKKEILQYLIDKNLNFSVPSLKADLIDKELLKLIKKGNQKTITLAPECNESLRSSIRKPVKDDVFFKIIEQANELKFQTIKLYFMINIPNQTQKDLDEMIQFIEKCNEKFKNKLYISINAIVPKPKTDFSKHTFNKKEIKQQLNYLKKSIKTKFKFTSLRIAEKEYHLSKAKELFELWHNLIYHDNIQQRVI